ncbi:MAG TPA: PKD domain-containing protein [Chitinophagaceae bacterium]|nr:PKD domain-containing protein [Chitinophagaceae bacterium]
MKRSILLLLILISFYDKASAQLCTTPGQTPVTAVLVCGTESFYASTPVYCGTIPIPVPCPAGFTYYNKNPNFFRMNCFASGTLGFVITPDNPTSDYSWQLFDITNTNPNEVFTNTSLFVACNWSSEPGETGASIDGTDTIVCGGGGMPLFSRMPMIREGRTYLLMVTNQNNAFEGYNITFTGGTASITDPVEPHLLSARASCEGNTIVLRGNKKLQCSSLAGDGSDFSISGGAVIYSAYPGDCTSPLGTDSIMIDLVSPLPIGTYTLTMNTGNDGNTLMDVCNRSIPENETISFEVTALQPITMDSLQNPGGCSPAFVDLVFDKGIQCSSIAPDGSDFLFTGPQPISAGFVPGACNTGSVTNRIRLLFNTPITVGGTYAVSLVTGNDGNSIIDECGLVVNPGSPLTFDVVSPLSPVFTINNPLSCKQDSIRFFHDGNNNTNSWNWIFGDGQNSSSQNPVHYYSNPGNYTATLIVKNNLCTDSSKQTIKVNGNLEAGFTVSPAICPGDTLQLVNTSTGAIDRWQWDLGDGTRSTLKTPSGHRYPAVSRDVFFTITLIASSDLLQCSDTLKQTVRLLSSCLIKVPTAFTPNGDGKNDFLYPLNAVKAMNLEFKVFNRYGQLVFVSRDWTRKWDGTINGVAQSTGVYAWQLSYTHADTGEKVYEKGTTLLLR